jgi:hypothetical protein
MQCVYSIKEGDLHNRDQSEGKKERNKKKTQTSREVEEGPKVENQLD